MAKENNPWLGWASYEEGDRVHKFVGRHRETARLFAMIEDYMVVTLYGRSGIGKTSLLRAGVFPVLRAEGYMPVVSRLGMKGDSYSQVLANIVADVATECTINGPAAATQPESLVEFLDNNTFENDGEEIFPVFVFDQYEDFLSINREAAVQLLLDIAMLADDSQSGRSNFRFVFTLREDYLYLFEDCIDAIEKPILKENRLRLLPVNEEGADEIISLAPVAATVRDAIKKHTESGSGYHTGFISFYCSELYDRTDGRIDDKALELLGNGNKLVEDYYKRCFAGGSFSRKTKKYIENSLQRNGVRQPKPLSEVEKAIPASDLRLLLANGRHKLLQKFPIGDQEHVELIHDKVAEIIHANAQRINRRRWLIASRILLLCLALAAAITGFEISVHHDRLLISSLEEWQSELDAYELTGDYSVISKRINDVYIKDGERSCWLSFRDSLPQTVNIHIPASLQSFSIFYGLANQTNLKFEVDTANEYLQEIDGALWTIGRNDKLPELEWADTLKTHIKFPLELASEDSIIYKKHKFYNVAKLDKPYITYPKGNSTVVEVVSDSADVLELSPDSLVNIKFLNLRKVKKLVLSEKCKLTDYSIVNNAYLEEIECNGDNIQSHSIFGCPGLARVYCDKVFQWPVGNDRDVEICLPDGAKTWPTFFKDSSLNDSKSSYSVGFSRLVLLKVMTDLVQDSHKYEGRYLFVSPSSTIMTDLHMINANMRFPRYIPAEISPTIRLHVPKGEVERYKLEEERNRIYFKEIVEDSDWRSVVLALYYQYINVSVFWDQNIWIVIACVALLLLIILLSPLRRLKWRLAYLIVCFLLIFYGLYYTMFGLTPIGYRDKMQIWEGLLGLIFSMIFTIYLFFLDKNKLYELWKYIKGTPTRLKNLPTNARKKSLKNLPAKLLSNFRKNRVIIDIFVLLVFIFLPIISDYQDKVKIMASYAELSKGNLYSALSLAPEQIMPNKGNRILLNKLILQIAEKVIEQDRDSMIEDVVERLPESREGLDSVQYADVVDKFMLHYGERKIPLSGKDRTLSLASNEKAVSPDSSMIAVGDYSGHVVIWKYDLSDTIATFDVYSEINSVCFAGDNKRLLIGSNEQVDVYDIDSMHDIRYDNIQNYGYWAWLNDSVIYSRKYNNDTMLDLKHGKLSSPDSLPKFPEIPEVRADVPVLKGIYNVVAFNGHFWSMEDRRDIWVNMDNGDTLQLPNTRFSHLRGTDWFYDSAGDSTILYNTNTGLQKSCMVYGQLRDISRDGSMLMSTKRDSLFVSNLDGEVLNVTINPYQHKHSDRDNFKDAKFLYDKDVISIGFIEDWSWHFYRTNSIGGEPMDKEFTSQFIDSKTFRCWHYDSYDIEEVSAYDFDGSLKERHLLNGYEICVVNDRLAIRISGRWLVIANPATIEGKVRWLKEQVKHLTKIKVERE